MSYLAKAIRHLKPNAEFSFTDEDYTTIKWDVIEGSIPSQIEIDAAIEVVKEQEAQAEAEAAEKKKAAEAKLKALGLTSEDLKALRLG